MEQTHTVQIKVSQKKNYLKNVKFIQIKKGFFFLIKDVTILLVV